MCVNEQFLLAPQRKWGAAAQDEGRQDSDHPVRHPRHPPVLSQHVPPGQAGQAVDQQAQAQVSLRQGGEAAGAAVLKTF